MITAQLALLIYDRANEFLEFCTERYLLPQVAVGGIECGSTVLDLGCGCGRDAVYLAQQLPPGTRVIGIDSHSGALDRAAKLAERWLDASRGGSTDTGVVGREQASLGPNDSNARRGCEWLKTDLRKEGSLDGLQASVVHGHRFLSMQALPWIRDEVSYVHASSWSYPTPIQPIDSSSLRVHRWPRS